MTTRRMLAIIIALMVLLGVSICFSSCSIPEDYEERECATKGLVYITRTFQYIDEKNCYQYFFYDPDTLVIYVCISGPGGSGFSVLYNSDGTPKTYTPNQ